MPCAADTTDTAGVRKPSLRIMQTATSVMLMSAMPQPPFLA